MPLKKVLLIANPVAGRGIVKRKIYTIVNILSSYGYATTLLITQKPGDAKEFAKNCGEEYEKVICAGGDGTLNEVICGLMANPVQHTLGYIPAGTTNDLAASLELSKDTATAVKDIVLGDIASIDIGSFNGRIFNYTASFGAFTEASYNASQVAKNLLGHAAYVLEGILSLGNIRPYKVALTCDGKKISGDFVFGTVCNTTSLGGVFKLDKTLVELSDGKFEVLLIKSPENVQEFQKIISALVNQNFKNDYVHLYHASKIKVETEEGIDWTLDGEKQSGERVTVIENIHNAVKLIVPARKESLE